ncbi:hypothetical protein WG66_012771 [Moniliophthora roreri]|nr:hypothetical protein WG66_012771 [Moniliophthora roreri]
MICDSSPWLTSDSPKNAKYQSLCFECRPVGMVYISVKKL